MANWAIRQKVKYTLAFLAIIFMIVGIPLALSIKEALSVPQTCTDGLQNQDERGVDCGGVCPLMCEKDVKPIELKWHKAFTLQPGRYDVAATIENKNIGGGTHNVEYRFELYDADGETIVERRSSTFLNPGERVTLIEGSLRTGERVAEGVRFGFTNNPLWIQAKPVNNPIRAERIDMTRLDSEPRIDVMLANTNPLESYEEIYVTAHVYDKEQRIVGVSETYLPFIGEGEEEDVLFSWPAPFRSSIVTQCENLITSTTSIETLPANVAVVFDRSGSMNDDNDSPPEPITTAKDAAATFVSELDPIYMVSLVSFAAEGSVDRRLTKDHNNVINAINGITIGVPDHEQHTNLGDAIEKASQELASVDVADETMQVIVALTDGIATRPLNPETGIDDGYGEEYAAQKAAAARSRGIDVYAIGLGSGVNEEYLQSRIASDPTKYYFAQSAADLESIYVEIARTVYREQEIVDEICVDREIFVPEVSTRFNTLPPEPNGN